MHYIDKPADFLQNYSSGLLSISIEQSDIMHIFPVVYSGTTWASSGNNSYSTGRGYVATKFWFPTFPII